MSKTATQTKGITEAKRIESNATTGWIVAGAIVVVGLIGLGMLGNALAGNDEQPQATPVVATPEVKPEPPATPVETTPEPKPLPTKQNTRDGNTIKVNGSNSGAVINGDGNRVNIDNSQRTTVIHHHHTVEKPVERVVYRTRTVTVKSERHEVSAECEDMMADHLERKAAMYRMIAAHKRGR